MISLAAWKYHSDGLIETITKIHLWGEHFCVTSCRNVVVTTSRPTFWWWSLMICGSLSCRTVLPYVFSLLSLQFAWLFPWLEGGCVMPAPGCRKTIPNSTLCAMEFYSGSFSGWTHVTCALASLGFPAVTALEVDSSEACAPPYRNTFGAEVVLEDWKLHPDWVFLNSKLVVQTNLNDFAWFRLAGIAPFQVGVCAHPCPAWSTASCGPGLKWKDAESASLAHFPAFWLLGGRNGVSHQYWN
eukprot:s74_g4.t1